LKNSRAQIGPWLESLGRTLYLGQFFLIKYLGQMYNVVKKIGFIVSLEKERKKKERKCSVLCQQEHLHFY